MHLKRWLVISCALACSACSSEKTPAESPGKELIRNKAFIEAGSHRSLPAFWEAQQEDGIEWQNSGGVSTLQLRADAKKAVTIRQEATLPQPLPAALRVEADIKLDGIQRGEKSWYSGRILVTYLDTQGKVLGETYTLDRLEGSSDWKKAGRQFPVPEGAGKVRLELQMLNAASGSLAFRDVSLRALNSEEAQAWRKEAGERIRQIRMAPLRIRVEDAAGKPLPDAEVAVFMRRHAYPFGTAVKSGHLIAPPGNPHTDTYRAVVENFFNYATLENELKAPRVEKNGLTEALAGLAWLKEHGIAPRGHVLTWPSFEMSSKAAVAAQDDPEKLRAVMKKHFHDLLTATEPYGIVDWDVLNEPALHNDLIRILGDEQVPEWFRWAREDAPAARLYLNENNVEFQGGNRENLGKWIQLLQAAKAPIGGIGWQGHMWHRTLPSGQNILDDLDYFSRYGLPIQITEYDTHERFSDGDDARFLDEFLTAWFSHPLTAGFIMWGFQDSYMWNGNGPLFRKDWSLKPSGKVWMDLVFGQWWTETAGKSGARGIFETRAFLGTYDIEVRQGGRRALRHADLGKEGLDLVIRLDAQAVPDEPSSRLVSSNPYRNGKLPGILPPPAKKSPGQITRTIALNEGKGASSLLPPARPGEDPGRWILQGHEKGLERRDLYLRFDPGSLAPGSVEKATLHFNLAEPLQKPVRVQFYVLSSRFVPQGREAGLDWKGGDMTLGRAPGRSADDGEYRLGDAAVIYLGEEIFANKAGTSLLSFSSGELARAVQASAGKGLTLMLSTTEPRLALAAPGHPSLAAPTLELQVKKP